jgi:hypothetical protein
MAPPTIVQYRFDHRGARRPRYGSIKEGSMKRSFVLIGLLVSWAISAHGAELAQKPRFANGATSTGWIRFEVGPGRKILLPARVNGHQTTVFLINGTPSRIDNGFAAASGMHAAPAASPGNGGAPADSVRNIEVQIGGMTLAGIEANAADLSSFAKTLGRPAPFWLGEEVFDTTVVDIDFPHRRIAFRDPARLVKPSGARELPVEVVAGEHTVPLSIEDGAPGHFAPWLGNSGDLLIYQGYYEAHGLLQGRQVSQRLAGGLGALNAEPVATMGHVQFAGVGFRQVPAALIPDSISKVDSSLLSGGLAAPMLARFRLIFDYPHDRLYVIRGPGTAGEPFDKDRLGLMVRRQDAGVGVVFVSPGSPAQAAGFKVGDKIKLIDGTPIEAWTDPALGVTFTFAMEGGEVRRIRSADFF